MEEELLFKWALRGGFAAAPCVCFICLASALPYGRHRSSFTAFPLPFAQVLLPARIAWLLLEIVPLLAAPLFFARGRFAAQPAPRALAALFLAHYAHRALVYPFRMRAPPAPTFPLIVLLSGLLFNLFNAYLQARSLSHFATYPPAWLSSPPFLLGFSLFLSGMAINIWADSALISLRKSAAPSAASGKSPAKYSIPRGGLFELVSCPNYFGEMLEWLGWAIATSSSAGLFFFVFTVCNLMPRGLAHHRWYVANFPDYPQARRAVIPFVL